MVAIGNWVIDFGKLPDGAYLFDINNGQITNFTAYTDADIAGMGLQLFSSIVGANYNPESDYTGGARLWQAGNIFVGLNAQQGGLGELSPNSAYTVRGNDVNWETLYNEFLTGEGPEYSGFGANHPMTKDLKNSWIVGIASAKFLLDNKANIENNRPLKPLIMYDVPFGLVGAGMSGTNMTEQFVGGARVSIIPAGAYTMYIVDNTTDRYSYRLHSASSIPRQQGRLTPEGTIYQRFMWIAP